MGVNVTAGPLAMNTNIFISGYSFINSTNQLQLTWQLRASIPFDPSQFESSSNSSGILWVLSFEPVDGYRINPLYVFLANQAIVDGVSTPVHVNLNTSSLPTISVRFPYFSQSIIYDPEIWFSRSTTTSGSFSSTSASSSSDNSATITGATAGGVFGAFLLLVLLFLIGGSSIIFIILCIKRRDRRRAAFPRAEGGKSLRRKEVETLWSLAEGKKRDAKAIFKAEREEDVDASSSPEMDEEKGGWGMMNLRKRRAKYLFRVSSSRNCGTGCCIC